MGEGWGSSRSVACSLPVPINKILIMVLSFPCSKSVFFFVWLRETFNYTPKCVSMHLLYTVATGLFLGFLVSTSD